MRASQMLPDHLDTTRLNGTTIRKGTVGAFLVNARIWSDPHASPASHAEAGRDIEEALPALLALGLFDVFEIREPGLRAWIARHTAALKQEQA
jgi:hypothetical protein